MRVLVAGHWQGAGEGPDPGAGEALDSVAEGFTATAAGWEADTVPFGPGPAFVEAVARSPQRHWAPIAVAPWEETTARAGREVLAALGAGLTPVVEGGHSIDVDAGLGLLGALLSRPIGRDEVVAGLLGAALEEGRALVAGRDVIVAASTNRSLLGLASTMAIGVDLEARDRQDRDLTAALARTFAAWGRAHAGLPVVGADTPDPSRMAGSGAAGGAGAVLAALGGRIVATGDLLADVTDLEGRARACDLVIVVEPHLSSPRLAESQLPVVTAAAAAHALPVVALAADSTLAPHERAEWGMHGVVLAAGLNGRAGGGEVLAARSNGYTGGGDVREDLRRAGARIARTWAPR